MEYEKTCAACGSIFYAQNENQVCCSSECGLAMGRKKKYYICQYCGQPFWKPNAVRKRYCCKECQQAARHDGAVERHKGLSPPPEPEAYQRKCLWRGEPFETKYPNNLYCSPTCSYEGNKRLRRDQWRAEYQPHVFHCKECARLVTTECGHTKSEFCSEECSEKFRAREYKNHRKEQMKEAFKSPVYFKRIYARGQGLCQICGLPVPYDKSPDKLWAATIDHIIPLSKGGTHEPNNCQLTHRLCNSIKLVEDRGFTINWDEKNRQDCGRWTNALKELHDLINLETARA